MNVLGGEPEDGAGPPPSDDNAEMSDKDTAKSGEGPTRRVRARSLAEALDAAGISLDFDDDTDRRRREGAARTEGFGSLLIRTSGLDPVDVEPGEQWLSYMMSMTVVVNACIASFTTPVALHVLFKNMPVYVTVMLSALAFVLVGVIDALVVAWRPGPGREMAEPPGQCPRMPGFFHRLRALVPRLLLTGMLVFFLGELLTFAANADSIARAGGEAARADQLALIEDRTKQERDAVTDAQKLVNDTETRLTKERATRDAAQTLRNCEVLGRPPNYTPPADIDLPACSGRAAPAAPGSASASAEERLSEATDAVKKTQTELGSDEDKTGLRGRLANAKAALEDAKEGVRKSKEYQDEGKDPEGIAGVRSALDTYFDQNDFPWYERWRWELIVAAIDMTPVLLKLFGGQSHSDANRWARLYNRRYRRSELDKRRRLIHAGDTEVVRQFTEQSTPVRAEQAIARLRRDSMGLRVEGPWGTRILTPGEFLHLGPDEDRQAVFVGQDDNGEWIMRRRPPDASRNGRGSP